MNRKRNLAVFIDGENIPAKRASRILQIAAEEGETDSIKVYGRQKDLSTSQWSKVAEDTPDMKDIRLYGPPEKDKVDRKIKKDIIKEVQRSKNIDIIMIVSSDHGYVDQIRSLRAMGKRVIVAGEAKCPPVLRKAASKFVLMK